MDGGGKKIESLCKYVPSYMALTYIETEKYHTRIVRRQWSAPYGSLPLK